MVVVVTLRLLPKMKRIAKPLPPTEFADSDLTLFADAAIIVRMHEERVVDDIAERLRAAIDSLLADMDSDHQPEWASEAAKTAGKDPLWCRFCGAKDGSWPCTHRMALDALKEARRD